MSLLTRIEHRVRRDFFHWRYRRAVDLIRDTAPLRVGELPFVLLSMVQKRDVPSYLVAVKSFARFAHPERVVVVCDPSIDSADRDILRLHVPHIELRAADEFTHAAIPRGGCWERLNAISEYNLDHYVVQLDADTVTRRPIPEVTTAIAGANGFVLGEIAHQQLLSLEQCASRASAILTADAHIQTCAEAVMSAIGLPEGALYVRGCAGFTGFPPGSVLRAKLLDFVGRMTTKLGARWANWGTEQVTSNYLVANAARTAVLPFPKYGTPDQALDETAFLHFIGSMRFINPKYEAASAEAIRALRR